MSRISFSKTLERLGESLTNCHYKAAQSPSLVLEFTSILDITLDSRHRCDERFIGYGGNKAACLFELYLSGIDFFVLSDDFIIHQSHAYAEQARKQEVPHGHFTKPSRSIY